MKPWACGACGAQWAPGAPRCPECPSTVHREVVEVPKILPNGQVTYEADVPREHPGTGVPMTAVEHPADGTMSPEVGNDGPDESELESELAAVEAKLAGLEATEAEVAPAQEPPAVHVPPRPPRRPSPVTGSGGVTLPKGGAASGE